MQALSQQSLDYISQALASKPANRYYVSRPGQTPTPIIALTPARAAETFAEQHDTNYDMANHYHTMIVIVHDEDMNRIGYYEITCALMPAYQAHQLHED
jgi:hypothetical protein